MTWYQWLVAAVSYCIAVVCVIRFFKFVSESDEDIERWMRDEEGDQ